MAGCASARSQYLYEPENLLITGGIDDVWVNSKGELIIVDYKATSKEGDVVLEGSGGWEMSYKRQMEIYQWLFRNNNFNVSDTGYFVYCNGNKDKKAFDKKLSLGDTYHIRGVTRGFHKPSKKFARVSQAVKFRKQAKCAIIVNIGRQQAVLSNMVK